MQRPNGERAIEKTPAAGPRPPTAWETYVLLADCLRRCLSDVPARLPPQVSWERLIAVASHHFVTPVLSWCLRAEPALPADVRSYLETIAALNRTRNGIVHDTLVSALQALNAGGVSPVLLKGIASLTSGLYPDSGLRVVSDIDLLVPLARADAANSLLLEAGFVPAGHWTREQYPDHHHLPAVRHQETGVQVELHRHVLLEEYCRLLPAESVLQQAQVVRVDGYVAALPRPTDRFVHALAHTQLQDTNFGRGTPELRQMLELALLSARYRAQIDWAEVVHCFRAAGHFDVLQDTCEIVGRLFGQRLPVAPPASGHDPLERVRRRLQRRIALPTPLLWTYLHTIRTRPMKLLELLKPQKLAEQILRVPDYVKQFKWK